MPQTSDPTHEELPKQGTYAVIDGNSLMHRAFHAIPPSMTAPDGRPTNAVFGFLSMFIKLLEDFAPDGIVVAFDKGAPQMRMDLLAQYKAQRPPRDPVLSEQFPMIRSLLASLNVPVLEVSGWEGDDILGTVAAQGSSMGHTMLLVTGDRDTYQLVNENVRVVATKKGITDVFVLGPQDVTELYDGVTPELIPDFYGLKGDTSDNIPGVPGIGPKKASALIVKYGSLQGVLDHADEIPGKMGENIRTHVDDALVSRTVATIRTDAPVSFDPQAAAWPQFDPEEVERAFNDLALISLKRRMLAFDASSAQHSQQGSLPSFDPAVVEGAAAWELLDEALRDGRWLGVFTDTGKTSDTLFGVGYDVWIALGPGWQLDSSLCDTVDAPLIETTFDESYTGPSTVLTASLTSTSVDGLAIPAGSPAETPVRVAHFQGDDALSAITKAYSQGKVSSFDVKADLGQVVPPDGCEACALVLTDIQAERIFDVSVAAYLLDSNRSDYSPRNLVSAYTTWAFPESDDVSSYAALAAVSASVLRDQLETMLFIDGTLACMQHIELPLIPCLVALERSGMNVSIPRLRELSESVGITADAIAQRIYDAAGEKFNIDSPQQLSSVLFEKLGLPTIDPETNRPLKKTKRGFYSTNAKILEGFARTQPVVSDVLEYREQVKIKSTYLDALPVQVGGDGRIHSTFNQTVTATGRLSSSNPNLQNIPVRSDLGKLVRTAFVPKDSDSVILSCDYSQIELRLLAHLSADDGLVEAFRCGEDFHSQTAARVFGVDPREVTPQQRSRAKAVNFGIVYGQTAWGLSQTLKISAAEAQEIIDRYYRTYPGVRGYLDSQVDFARAHGWVATMFGRKRHVPDIHARMPAVKQFAERTAMNHPMQGSAADIIKLAMVRVRERLVSEGFAAQMVVQVHDELDFDCPLNELDRLKSLVVDVMQNVVELRVPLIVSCAHGTTWADAK